nr:MAG TPA: hypothetical protein [Caudoviricetes sp.]
MQMIVHRTHGLRGLAVGALVCVDVIHHAVVQRVHVRHFFPGEFIEKGRHFRIGGLVLKRQLCIGAGIVQLVLDVIHQKLNRFHLQFLLDVGIKGFDLLLAHFYRDVQRRDLERKRLGAHIRLCGLIEGINVHVSAFGIIDAHSREDRLFRVLREDVRQTRGQDAAASRNDYSVPAGEARSNIAVDKFRYARLNVFHFCHGNTSCFKARGGYCRPFLRLVVAAASALWERVVERLRRCGGSGGDVRDLLGIKGCVRVSHDGVVAAAATFSLAINRSKALLLDAVNVLTHERKAVLRALIVHRLFAERAADVLELPVDVLVHLKHLLVAVGVGIAQSDLRLQFCDLLLLRQLIAADGRILAAIAVVGHRAIHRRGASRSSEHPETAICKRKRGTTDAKAECGSRQTLGGIVAAGLFDFYHLSFLL